MSNQEFAFELLTELARRGVREFCVCAGARNSPILAIIIKLPYFKNYHFFEERSAAFFALGRIKATKRPVAVVTTSGTAVGELLPATMEAHYSGLPLVLLTADRPRRFRGSGAPQTAEQPGIFGTYVEKSLDLAATDSVKITTESWTRLQPLHLNACFEEPLLETSSPEVWNSALKQLEVGLSAKDIRSVTSPAVAMNAEKLQGLLAESRFPFAIVSALQPEDREAVRAFLLAQKIPAYLEATSGLREDPSLADLRVHVSDGLRERALRENYPIDSVLRFGGVPTLRLWRDLENEDGKTPVLSLTREPFSGLSWSKTVPSPIHAVLKLAALKAHKTTRTQCEDFLNKDRETQKALESLLERRPLSEAGLFHGLSKLPSPTAKIFVGNSLPIREWDLAASFAPSLKGGACREIGASRGLNGIDGQVSTFLGNCDPNLDNWGILGDLTTLYDLPGPWILSQLDPRLRATLVVVNNSGGKIFSRMFPQTEFQNPHGLSFRAWAQMWSLPYECWDSIPTADSPWSSAKDQAQLRIVELVPHAKETAAFWKEAEALWRK